MNDIGFALRDELRAERDALIDAFRNGGSVRALLRGLARATDRSLRRIVRSAALDRCMAVVAVGGYGRGELFPHSDVDILILHDEQLAPAELERVERLIGQLWDVGLHIGHSVRTIAQCCEEARQDVTVLTSLLEARLVIGPRALYRRFAAALAETLDARAFFRAKLLEQQQRHTKYQDTPYSLEPNVKENPGGLRDLQMVLWVARAANLGRSWRELQRRNLLTREECRMLLAKERIIQQIRAHLHIVAGRREDRLLFDVQNAVATALRIAPTATRRASEMLMQRYYLAAKAVTQLNTLLLLNLEARLFPRGDEASVPLDETFFARHELLDIADDDALTRDPNGYLRAFLLVQQHPELKGMAPRLLRALWHGRFRFGERFRRDPRNRQTFLAILQQPQGVLHALRMMNQWSVLGRYLPVFRRIVGQMQHDLFHVYTVDQHILMVLRNLRRFTMAEHAHEYPLCSQLIADFERPWLLYIAALFHDIAKGRGGDHSELGARDAQRFCRQHGLSAEDTALVVWLVREHLTMSRVAQKQDIADPEVVRRFARVVGTERRLIALYLLTVADIRGTSPRVWNAWKAKLLEDLFLLTRRQLGGESVPVTAELEGRKREALRLLRLYALSEHAHEPLWAELDVVYFMRHTAQDIAWHTRALIAHLRTERPIVRTRLAPGGEGAEVLIYVRDQKDLFARVCGYFDSRGLNILDAKIHTTRHGYALDTFVVTDNGRAQHYRELLSQIEHELAEWIAAARPLHEPTKGRLSRHSRHFPVTPSVYLTPDERGEHYLLQITATDRIGLLYAIARVLSRHGVNVYTAKIMTLGERVEDVFLIDSAALASPREQLQLESDLLEALSPVDR
ncbi:MAG TPA: [protein-PII] uridylyltransferase [Burkholderiaceae bacterium]|jgi:[protein-PII] uridylyltransferase|nr:[protein-PII] uridylyltransferase [Burkholderiaceae bacterium]